MPVSPDRFRDVLGRLAGGVAIVTARKADGSPSGATATAVCSVSLSPPLVLACLDVGTHTHDAIQDSGCFALNLLSEDESALARRFGLDGGKKFRGLSTSTAVTGSPLLEGGLGFLDCSLVHALPAGDHTIFVGRVEAAESRASGAAGPLLYFRGGYGALGRPLPGPRGRSATGPEAESRDAGRRRR